MQFTTADPFTESFQKFNRQAFRFEAQYAYPLGDGREDFERFLAGTPVPPPECAWLQPWLRRLSDWTLQGKIVSRVRVLAEPPTDYQRWLVYGHRWMVGAGEDIQYVHRSTAQRLGLPLGHDWWLFDDEWVIEMRFTPQGEVRNTMAVTDRAAVANYCNWRDTALRNSVTASIIVA